MGSCEDRLGPGIPEGFALSSPGLASAPFVLFLEGQTGGEDDGKEERRSGRERAAMEDPPAAAAPEGVAEGGGRLWTDAGRAPAAA